LAVAEGKTTTSPPSLVVVMSEGPNRRKMGADHRSYLEQTKE